MKIYPVRLVILGLAVLLSGVRPAPAAETVTLPPPGLLVQGGSSGDSYYVRDGKGLRKVIGDPTKEKPDLWWVYFYKRDTTVGGDLNNVWGMDHFKALASLIESVKYWQGVDRRRLDRGEEQSVLTHLNALYPIADYGSNPNETTFQKPNEQWESMLSMAQYLRDFSMGFISQQNYYRDDGVLTWKYLTGTREAALRALRVYDLLKTGLLRPEKDTSAMLATIQNELEQCNRKLDDLRITHPEYFRFNTQSLEAKALEAAQSKDPDALNKFIVKAAGDMATQDAENKGVSKEELAQIMSEVEAEYRQGVNEALIGLVPGQRIPALDLFPKDTGRDTGGMRSDTPRFDPQANRGTITQPASESGTIGRPNPPVVGTGHLAVPPSRPSTLPDSQPQTPLTGNPLRTTLPVSGDLPTANTPLTLPGSEPPASPGVRPPEAPVDYAVLSPPAKRPPIVLPGPAPELPTRIPRPPTPRNVPKPAEPAVNPNSDELVWVPPGSFLMGSPAKEPGRFKDEGPQHEVTFAQGFWMGKTEVSQRAYEGVMNANPSSFRNEVDAPVESVSHAEAQTYCRKVTEREMAAGRLAKGFAYRLPTEAEWEYACRAGSQAAFAYGDDASGQYLDQAAWFKSNTGGAETGSPRAVGRKEPNAWGLFDMHGNVAEWCFDVFALYTQGSPAGQISAAPDAERVVRGGSWADEASLCRSAARKAMGASERSPWVGFRIVLAAGQ